jgi:hypothetical protein
MNTVPIPVGKFTASPDHVSCHSVSNHPMCAFGLFFVVPISQPQRLALASVFELPPAGAWAWAQGFAFKSHARLSHQTESSSLSGPLGSRLLRTGISLSVALHGRLAPPQLLSATGRLTWPDGDFHPATLSSSQSHDFAPSGAEVGTRKSCCSSVVYALSVQAETWRQEDKKKAVTFAQ